MRISSLPHSSIAPVSNTASHLSNSPSGISNSSSSIEMRQQAQSSSGGFCSCITDLIERICRFLGLSSSQATTTATRTANSAQDRINLGKNILTAHFQSDAIRNDDGQHSAIAVIMNYNGRNVVSIASANAQKDSLDVLKDRLENLISQDLRAPDNAELQISTVYFKKNHNFTFAYHAVTDRASFRGDIQSSPGSLIASASFLDFATIVRNIDIGMWNCPQNRKEEIKLFLARL